MNSYFSRPLLPKEGSRGSCYSCMGKSTPRQKLPVCSKNKSKDERQRKWPSHQRMWIKQLFCNGPKYCTVIMAPWFLFLKALRNESFCSHTLQRQYSHKLKGSKSLSITPEQLIPNKLFYAVLQPHPVHYQQLPLWRCALVQNTNHPDTGHITFISYTHQWKQGSRATWGIPSFKWTSEVRFGNKSVAVEEIWWNVKIYAAFIH